MSETSARASVYMYSVSGVLVALGFVAGPNAFWVSPVTCQPPR